MTRWRSLLAGWIPAVGLVALGFLIWGGTLLNNFTYDDLDVILYRLRILFFRPWNFFTREYFQLGREMSWRPVTTASYVIDFMIWGRSPVGFHLTNLVLHIATVLLFWRLARTVTGSPSMALVAPLVAMIHPAAGSTVCVPGFREEMIVVFAILVAWACWDLPRQVRWNGLWGVGAVLASAAAILGKELGAVMPVATLLIWLAARQRGRRVAPFRCVAVVAAIQAVLVAGYIALILGPMHSLFSSVPGGYGAPGPIRALESFCWIHLRYLGLMIWPFGYAADHPIAPFASAADPRVLAGAAVLLAVAAVGFVCIVRPGKTAVAGLGLLWWGLFLATTSGIAPLPNPMADRFLYSPLFGFALVAGWAGWKLRRTLAQSRTRPATKRAVAAGAFGLAGILLVLWMRTSVDQVVNDRSERSLWEWTLAAEPTSTRALHNLGVEAVDRLDFRRAAECFGAELRLQPRNWKAMLLLSSTLIRLNRVKEADVWLDKALATAPDQREVHEARIRHYLFAKPPQLEKARQALNDAQHRFHVRVSNDLAAKVNALSNDDRPTSP